MVVSANFRWYTAAAVQESFVDSTGDGGTVASWDSEVCGSVGVGYLLSAVADKNGGLDGAVGDGHILALAGLSIALGNIG